MNYQEYKKDFLTDLRNSAVISGSDTEDEFVNWTLDILSEFDEIEDPARIGMGDKKGRGGRLMRVDGYSFDIADRSLVLFISDFQDTYTPENLTMSRVDELYWRLYYFLDETCNGSLDDYFDDSDDVLKLGRLIKRRINATGDDEWRILKIKFFIFTNKELGSNLLTTNLFESSVRKKKGRTKQTKTTKKIKKAEFNGKPLEINLWHIGRFYDMENSNINEPIIIDIAEDFPELNYSGIPCIKGNVGENLGYDAYIAIIPGKLLASIYIEHGSKVLEGNVRAFLGTSGSKSVNSGIRKTINNDPTKFFTYNNGIAVTAADVEIAIVDGELMITKIVDMQIINGGQTTASLAEAVLKRTNVDLDGIFVPMKLTVIEDRETENVDGVRFYDEMVQAIARYANSQNKVTAADLFSNEPFHIWMERTSKKHLAPPKQYAISTGWYYERSRKRYQQEQFKLRGDDAKKFLATFPKKQLINKEQLAMYYTAVFDCKPHIVSRGKNWVMREFGAAINKKYNTHKKEFNGFYFERCICAAIIFRTIDEYLEKNKDSVKRPTGFWYKTGGYKLNIVPYTIAKILSSIPKGYTLDWKKIWNNQSISSAFMREIEIVTRMTNDFICDSHGIIVTEYCKRQTTWDEYRDTVKYNLSNDFIKELITEEEYEELLKEAGDDQGNVNEFEVIIGMINKGAGYWNSLMLKGATILSFQEKDAITQIINIATKGEIPADKKGNLPNKVKTIMRIVIDAEKKLDSEGISV